MVTSSDEESPNGGGHPQSETKEQDSGEEEEFEEEVWKKGFYICARKGLHPHAGKDWWEFQFNKAGISTTHPVILFYL